MQNPQGPANSETMRQADVLAELKISRTTLIAMERQGYVTPFRLPSGHRRYYRADVEALRGRVS